MKKSLNESLLLIVFYLLLINIYILCLFYVLLLSFIVKLLMTDSTNKFVYFIFPLQCVCVLNDGSLEVHAFDLECVFMHVLYSTYVLRPCVHQSR